MCVMSSVKSKFRLCSSDLVILYNNNCWSAIRNAERKFPATDHENFTPYKKIYFCDSLTWTFQSFFISYYIIWRNTERDAKLQ